VHNRGGDTLIKTEEKCQEVGRNDQHELDTNHQQQAMPDQTMSKSAGEKREYFQDA
jgi:hypothetical protein